MIDFPERLLRQKAKKNQKLMTLLLHPAFLRWLEARPRGAGKAPVFPDLFGKKPGGSNGLPAQFRKLMDRAKVHGRVIRTGEGGGHKTTRLSFHSLRHTFTSMMANPGVHPGVRRKLTGHSSEDVHKIYSHHEIETIRGAVEKLTIGVEPR